MYSSTGSVALSEAGYGLLTPYKGRTSLVGIINELVATSSGATDHKVITSVGDATPGYLNGKLKAGSNIILTPVVDGGIEKIQIQTSTGGGGTKPDFVISRPPVAFTIPGTAGATLETHVLTYGTIDRLVYAESPPQFADSIFIVPPDLDPAGTVTFETYGSAITPTGGVFVQMCFDHSPVVPDGRSDDAGFTSVPSGDQTPFSYGPDNLDRFVWTARVSDLGWTPNMQVRMRLSRIATSGSSLPGDYAVNFFRISVPRV